MVLDEGLDNFFCGLDDLQSSTGHHFSFLFVLLFLGLALYELLGVKHCQFVMQSSVGSRSRNLKRAGCLCLLRAPRKGLALPDPWNDFYQIMKNW